MIRFLQNVGDFFPSHFFDDDFARLVRDRSGHSHDTLKALHHGFVGLPKRWYALKTLLREETGRLRDRIRETHLFHTEVLKVLGYVVEEKTKPYAELYHLSDTEVVPVRKILYVGDAARLMVLEMQAMLAEGDAPPQGLFEQHYETENDALPVREQRYHRDHWSEVFTVPPGCRLSPTRLNKVVSHLFQLPERERPRYILLLAGNRVFLLEGEKWFRGAWLEFDLEALFDAVRAHGDALHYATFALLAGKEALLPEGRQVVLEILDEDAHKRAYEVTQDLKLGVIHAVEALANEALFSLSAQGHLTPDALPPKFATEVRDDCLTLVYRLLFVFYAESREELSLLPVGDPTYLHGYSLEMLRDLELVPLHSESARNGYFIHDSLAQLFRLLHEGYGEHGPELTPSFNVRKVDSPLFDESQLHWLKHVKVRNHVWQGILRNLSLSREQRGRSRGRISYANLGINQLGSVYESLLSYRGFYADEDYIEVHPPGQPDETYLVPRARRDTFKAEEVLRDAHGDEVILPKGRFVYRMSGRDRRKSASYYTPESLTRLTVRYALKPFHERLETKQMQARDLLRLTLFEPAMGAAAFHNEMMNQVAETYLTWRQRELQAPIPPDAWREELQKVKAYIATHNVYGVDLNPTAIELGKLSLWLNGIHRDMETPFFAQRLACGNAVVGAGLKVWRTADLTASRGKKAEWWTRAPDALPLGPKARARKPDEVYHFLVPDPGMGAAASVKRFRDTHPAEVKRLKERVRALCAPFVADELRLLQDLSRRIDDELKRWHEHLERIERLTQNHYEVYGATEHGEQARIDFRSYADKQRLAEARLQRDAAYYKLKLAMDYWCALWFWDVRDAATFPTREEFLSDLLRLFPAATHTPQDRPTLGFVKQPRLFHTRNEQLSFEDIVAERDHTEDLIQSLTPTSLYDDNARLRTVKRLAEQHRFFHPHLEFYTVFRSRGGFDLICGNPPWIKTEFDEAGVVGDAFPEVFTRSLSASDLRTQLGSFLRDETLNAAYHEEATTFAALSAFLGASQNYPLLEGQQANLYKCILTNSLSTLHPNGVMGLVHPEGIYDDPNAVELRKHIYKRLVYHFEFKNGLFLFAEVHDQKNYSVNIYGEVKQKPQFYSINNLFHPSTVDGCFIHSGYGYVGGVKVRDEKSSRLVWNTAPHRDRVVPFTEKELRLLARTFEDSDDWEGAKLVSLHARPVLDVLQTLSAWPTKVRDVPNYITVCWDETIARDKGIIKRETRFPNLAAYELIYSGPHFFVGNPFYKTPRAVCSQNSHYDEIDLTQIPEDFVPRTNYVPVPRVEDFRQLKNNNFDNKTPWIDSFRVASKEMIGSASERTLQTAILYPKLSHVNTVISVQFENSIFLLDYSSFCISLVADFYIKTRAKGHYNMDSILPMPIGFENPLQDKMHLRTLLLNCLTRPYAPLWEEAWQEGYRGCGWSREDARLPSFSRLGPEWTWETPLRTPFARRQALVELDVLVAKALGLSLEQLELIYDLQFPVLQQNESDTWYDQRGEIVFTCSKGLTGVGVTRAVWEKIRHLGAGETYEHTVDPSRNQLYGGRKIVYEAPFTCCDRVEDYRAAWAVL